MGSLARFNLSLIKRCFSVNKLYETGTGHGYSTEWASKCGIEHITTIEEDLDTLNIARARLSKIDGLHFLHGDSIDLVKSIPPRETDPRIFFLDAHFVGGADFKGSVDAYIVSATQPRSFPLIEELVLLSKKDVAHDWIVIDDARMYVDGEFDHGVCPEWARQWHNREVLERCLSTFNTTHHIHLLRQDEGYFVLIPHDIPIDILDVVYAFPGEIGNNTAYKISQARAEVMQARAEVAQARAEVAQARADLSLLYSSRSYRATKPLRFIAQFTRQNVCFLKKRKHTAR